MSSTEWDWAPRRGGRRKGAPPILAGRIRSERIEAYRVGTRSGWRSPTDSKIASAYVRTMAVLFTMALGAAIGLVLAVCAYLLVALIRF
jgi:hypothetical protein